MSIEIITMWYNEEALAPFFLKHYSWADKITLLYDEDTSDNSLEIIRKAKNVTVIPFKFPDMMDDEIKIDLVNRYYRESACDYVLAVDADEFVFFKKNDTFIYDLNIFLEDKESYDVFYVTLYQVYKHKNDKKLDCACEAIPQRRHGDPNITTGLNLYYNKPILVKTKINIQWTVGCHFLELKFPPLKNYKISKLYNMYFNGYTIPAFKYAPFVLLGAHWSMADQDFSIKRRIIDRRLRQSKNNLDKGMTIQHHNITEESLLKEFKSHENDPQLF